MEVRLRYFDGCPNWRIAYRRLRDALGSEGLADVEPVLELVERSEDAERLGFVGSPTILVNGVDPFATGESAFGLACRVYETPAGLAGSPTKAQLREVLRTA